jgi:hypothetical protein
VRLHHLQDAELQRYWRLAVQLLWRYQSARAFRRLLRIVWELDRRGIYPATNTDGDYA